MAVITEAIDFIKAHPVGSALVGGGAALAIGGTAVSVARARSARAKTTRKKSTKKSSSKKNSSVKRKSKKSKCPRNYKYARTAGKGKDRSTKRIRMTKNGQPYIILKSGKARFISKRSACLSRRRKGGKY